MASNENFRAGLLSNKELKELLPNVIEKYDPDTLVDLHYEIHVGDIAWVSAIKREEQKKLNFSQAITITPSQVAVIRSSEYINMPKNISAIIEPESFLEDSILIDTKLIRQPNTPGYIFFILKNLSDENFELIKGVHIGNIFFMHQENDSDIVHPEKMNPLKYPKPLKRRIESHIELVDKVDSLEKELLNISESDRILLSADINELWSSNSNFIIPYERTNLLDDGYTFSVGEFAEAFIPQKGDRHALRRTTVRITSGNPLIIQPGHTAVFRTLEDINLPTNISLLLYPLANLSRRYLIYDICPTKPGYHGFIWCKIHNYGTSNCELAIGEPIFYGRFTEYRQIDPYIDSDQQIDDSDRVVDVPDNEVPDPPTREWEDIVTLTEKVHQLEEDVKNYGPTKQIIEFVFMAAFAGIIAAIFIAILQAFSGVEYSAQNIKSFGVWVLVVIIGVINVYLYFKFIQIQKRR